MICKPQSIDSERLCLEEGSGGTNGSPWEGKMENILQVDSYQGGTEMGGPGWKEGGDWLEGENAGRVSWS